MTYRKDFKKRVRARMAQANESYTAAKRHVEAAAPTPTKPPPPIPYTDDFAEWLKQPGLGDYLRDFESLEKVVELGEALATALREGRLQPVHSYDELWMQLVEVGLVTPPAPTKYPGSTAPDNGWADFCDVVNAWDRTRPDREKYLPAFSHPLISTPKEAQVVRDYLSSRTTEALQHLLKAVGFAPPRIVPTDIAYKDGFSEWLLQPGLPEYLRDRSVPENAVALTKAVAQALKEGRLQPFATDSGLHRRLPTLNLPNSIFQPYDALCDLADVWSSMRPPQKAPTFNPPLTPPQAQEVQALREKARQAITQEAEQTLKDLKARDEKHGGTPVHSAQTSGYKYVLWAHLPQGTNLVTEGPPHPKGYPHYVLPTGEALSFQEADRWVASQDLATQLVYTPRLPQQPS